MTPPAAEAALIARRAALAPALARHPPWPGATRPQASPYEALVRAVAFQQLSGHAAQAILDRVIALFPGSFPEPGALAAAPAEALRAAGLSRQKIAAVQDIAQRAARGDIPSAAEIEHLPDDDIIARLTQARGVGRWTVEMYLMFTLGRPDVWPLDDLGVRKGAERLFGRSFTAKDLSAFGAEFSPWRSALAWHCWRAAETKTP